MEADKRKPSLEAVGLRFGAKLGLVLSTLYLILLTSLQSLHYFTTRTREPISERWETVGDLIRANLSVGWFAGIAPAIILGAITSWILVQIIETFRYKLTRKTVAIMGIFVCFSLMLILQGLLMLPLNRSEVIANDFRGLYFPYLGIPTIIYILAGGYTAVHLYNKSIEDSTAH